MPRGNQTSSRKRFFEDLDNIGHHRDISEQVDDRIKSLQKNIYDNAYIRMSPRRRFFQNLNRQKASETSRTSENRDIDTSEQLDEEMNNNEENANHNTQFESRISSRNIYFQQLDSENTVAATSQTFEDEQTGNSLSGQGHYQRQRQGIIIEYKDFGDNIFQCIHCNAYYWKDEMNTRGVYTGCCKGGQVRLQPSKPTPTFLEYLLDPNNGAKDKLGITLLKIDFSAYAL